MKTQQLQKLSTKLLPYGILCGLVLIFAYQFPVAGRDLSFAATMGEGGLSSWLAKGKEAGGSFLSAFLGALLIDVPLMRHLLIAGCLSALWITVISFSGGERPYMYFPLLFLGLTAPAGIFAYCFSSTLGAATVLPPALLTVLYVFTVSDLMLYKGRKKGWKIPFLFLSGLTGQLFSRGIGLSLLLLSLCFFLIVSRRYGLSWHLGAHCFGCVLGFGASLWLPGGADTLGGSFYTMADQLTLALDLLFTENLLLLGLLTLGCLLLIRPLRRERSRNCNITLYLLLIPMAVFGVLKVAASPLEPFVSLGRFLTALKLPSALAYCIGIYRTLQHYVSKDKIRIRTGNALLALWVFLLVFAVTPTALPSVLYLPYGLMTAVTFLTGGYALRRYHSAEKVLRKPLFLVGVAGTLMISFVTLCNNGCWKAVDTHLRENLSAGTYDLTLPKPPYEDRFVMGELSDYYDFPSYGNVKISYVPFAQWDWKTYYETHKASVTPEYDEDAQFAEEWAYEFEEDKG